VSDDPEDISAALGFVQAVREGEQLEEWKEAYCKGWRERNQPWTRPAPPSPPPSLSLIAHFAYLDRLIGGIRELDTARSEQRIRRACVRLIREEAARDIR
jgi:hypothetical protein